MNINARCKNAMNRVQKHINDLHEKHSFEITSQAKAAIAAAHDRFDRAHLDLLRRALNKPNAPRSRKVK